MGEAKKKERSRTSAFSKALRRSRSEKVEADWRWTISVNLGWRQVPGEGGYIFGGVSVVDAAVGREAGVRTNAVVVAIVGIWVVIRASNLFCLESEWASSTSGLLTSKVWLRNLPYRHGDIKPFAESALCKMRRVVDGGGCTKGKSCLHFSGYRRATR
jgi:hypothetical protein